MAPKTNQILTETNNNNSIDIFNFNLLLAEKKKIYTASWYQGRQRLDSPVCSHGLPFLYFYASTRFLFFYSPNNPLSNFWFALIQSKHTHSGSSLLHPPINLIIISFSTHYPLLLHPHAFLKLCTKPSLNTDQTSSPHHITTPHHYVLKKN